MKFSDISIFRLTTPLSINKQIKRKMVKKNISKSYRPEIRHKSKHYYTEKEIRKTQPTYLDLVSASSSSSFRFSISFFAFSCSAWSNSLRASFSSSWYIVLMDCVSFPHFSFKPFNSPTSFLFCASKNLTFSM